MDGTVIYSRKLKAAADSYGAGVPELVMADLVAIGYTRADAFYIAFPEYRAKSQLQARNLMDSIAREDRFKAILKDRGRMRDTAADAADGGLISRQEAAAEVLRTAQMLPEGSKERLQAFSTYAEILRKNNEGVDAGNDHVNYYLPLTCGRCSLYKEWRKAHPGQEPGTGGGAAED